jgi:hypothetical protein
VNDSPPEDALPAPAAAPKGGVLRQISRFSVSTYKLTRGFGPLVKLLASDNDVTRE